MKNIINYLNENPCLSEEWKKNLLHLIEFELNHPNSSIDSFFVDELKEMIIRHEGKRNHKYYDSLGVPTIGVGFNLQRSDATEILKSLGAIPPYDFIDDKIVYALLDISINEALGNVRLLFNDFDKHPKQVRLVLADMMFNLGPSRFSNFKKMIKAVNSRDYNSAANEMVDSKWYSQVGNRSKKLVELMKGSQ